MSNKTEIIPAQDIAPLIRSIRDQRVILDTDLARLYGVQTFRLNEAVKRNRDRFPGDFLFQLTPLERDVLTSQFAMSKAGRGGRRTLTFAFAEHGALMAATVLNRPRAVAMSLYIIRAFAKMREDLAAKASAVCAKRSRSSCGPTTVACPACSPLCGPDPLTAGTDLRFDAQTQLFRAPAKAKVSGPGQRHELGEGAAGQPDVVCSRGSVAAQAQAG